MVITKVDIAKVSFAKTIRRSDHTIMVITKVDIATTKVDIATVSFAKTIRRSDHTIMVITKVDIATVSFAKTIRQRQRHTILVFIFSKDYFLQWRMLLQQTAAKVI